MIKVLFVNTVPTDKSGIPNVIFNLLSKIDVSKYEIGYVSINEPTDFFKDKLYKVKAKLFVIPRKLSKLFVYVTSLAKIARNYDIIHVHGNSATMVLEMIAAKIANVKVRIAHSHNTTCNMKIIDTIARPLFYALCNGRLACGIEAGKWLFGKKEFTIINNGIDVEKFIFNKEIRKSIRGCLGIGDEYVIGHIGNFVEQKNHSFLIDLFYNFSEIHPNSKLLLLGNGPLIQSIQSKVNDLGICDKVIFAGSVDNPNIYMNAMDIIVMPSLFEGLPLTLIEEQANGLSIVAANTITTDANISGSVKFYSLSDNIQKWVGSIQKILIENNHNEKSSRIAVSQIKEAKYDIDSVVDTICSYYNVMVKQ